MIHHPLHLYVPQEGNILAGMTGKELAADRGWGSALTNRVTIHHSQGDHFSMMTGERADHLAHQLREFMKDGPVNGTSATVFRSMSRVRARASG